MINRVTGFSNNTSFKGPDEKQRTLCMLKPDSVERKHVGEIIHELEKDGFEIKAMKMLKLTPEQGGVHYDEHEGRSYFNNLVEYISRGPVIAMVLERNNAIAELRAIIGKPKPGPDDPDSIRKRFAVVNIEKDIVENCVHASDSEKNAEKEMSLYFSKFDILT